MAYKIILLLHIVGALLLSAAIAIEWLCIVNLRKADSIETIKNSVLNYSTLSKIGPVAMLLILVPGIYMAATVWGGPAWITVSFAGLILLAAIGGLLTGRKMPMIKNLFKNEEEISNELQDLLLDNSFWISLKLRTAIFLGIIFLMVIKPGLAGAIITLCISIGAGFLPIPRKRTKIT